MFRRRREKRAMKEAAKKAKKAEEEAARNIQLVRVAPRGTQYGGESPDSFPLASRSRSMDVLNGDLPSQPPHTLLPRNEVTNGKKKKGKLRRAQSLAEDGMLAQSPQERYKRDAPAYYYNGYDGLAPVYVINERGNGHVHPSTRPRYVVGLSPQHSLDPAYFTPGTPVLYQPQQPLPFNQHHHQQYQVPTTPDIPSTPSRAARSRNVQIIPRPGQESKQPQKQRPVSHFYPTSTPLRPTSTPLRTPSPIRTPSPAIFNTTPRNKGKGKAIKIVEGWDDEPDQESPEIVQSHEVGVAPKSKVMDDFMNRNSSSPFSITINDKNASVTPSSHVQMREPSRRNKARPVSAAPWAMIVEDTDYQQKTDSIRRQNGHSVVDFTE